MFRALFLCFPFVVFGLLVLGFLFPSCRALQVRTRTCAIWAAAILLCCSKFFFFKVFGGDEFNPELPQALIWILNWLFSGAMILFFLSCVLFFLPSRTKVILLPVLAWALAARGVWNGVKIPDVREIEIDCPALPAALDGYRILHLSDLHVSSAARRWRTEAVVARANTARAHLIVCTGDIVDGPPRLRLKDAEPLKGLRAKDGVFFVAGNHEFYGDWDGWRAIFDRWGLRFLRNDCVFPHESLALGGVDDGDSCLWGAPAPDVEQAFAAATGGEFRILLQHRPGDARANVFSGVRLQLSGHTHGGIAPLLKFLVAHWNAGFVRGVYRISDDGAASGQEGRLHVSPGCGQWAGFPIRFFDDAEMTLIKLRRKAGEGGRK